MKYQPDLMSMSPKGCTFIMFILLVIIVAIGMSSCGPAYHVRRAEHHIDKAIEKGADIKKDTITFHFKSPKIKFNTTIRPEWLANGSFAKSLAADTLTATDKKTGSTIRAKIDQATNCPDSCNRINTVYLEADVPGQDQTVHVPCETVQAGYTGWEMIILAIACLATGAVLGRLFWK